jgi:hypothetical protein
MCEPKDLTDLVEIQALYAEFTDAVMMNDHQRFGSLFTPEGALRIPDASIDAVGPAQIRALGEKREAFAECFVQNTHPGTVDVDGDTASGRSYMFELFQLRDGTSYVNYAVYHDRYERTSDGWRFAERVYEVRYVDATPLAGGVPGRLQSSDNIA